MNLYFKFLNKSCYGNFGVNALHNYPRLMATILAIHSVFSNCCSFNKG